MIDRLQGKFTIIANDVIMNNLLSAKAKGIYMYLVHRSSTPGGWQFHESEIIKNFKDGRDSIRAGIRELQEHNLLLKVQNNKGKGFSKVDWILNPTDDDIALNLDVSNADGKPVDAKPVNGKPVDGKPTTNNTNTINTDFINTDSTSSREDFKKSIKRENISQFRQRFINQYQNQTFTTIGLGWLPDTEFIINQDGYILNTVSQKVLDKDEAFKVWNYLKEKDYINAKN